ASLDARNRDTGEPVVEPAEESAESDPVAMAIEGELAAAVRRELANLPPLQRAAVELKAMDRSLREIAEILDVTAANAGVLVHRGRKLLAERLAPYLQES
ncbi:MAG TPA: sigma factor-like helix-turn-helix DNA-binding protein, partial [Planctomycetota bacterium]|nr:sigma factor-like helix-turn-helix DNA-binding protein [Planctomycetota bacterium]